MPSRRARSHDPRAEEIAAALRSAGLTALPDRNGRACVDVYQAGTDLAEAMPYEIVAYFDLEPFEALDNRGIAEEILRQMGTYLRF